MLKPMFSGFESFIRAERFVSLNEEGKLLSVNVWTDEAAVECWRDGRQFHIPYGIRMALGLPTQKLEEVLKRLKQHVL